MNLEQKITIAYSLLGIASGFISHFFIGWIPLLLYFASLPFLPKLAERKKKFFWLFYNSLLTFILVWLMVWILLFNLW